MPLNVTRIAVANILMSRLSMNTVHSLTARCRSHVHHACRFHSMKNTVFPASSSLQSPRCQSSFFSTEAKQNNSLLQHLQARIKMCGPITVADYMKEVLTSSHCGYYMHRDVFGSAGDFITSPEISQMFGEMLGIWVVNEWMNHYHGENIQIVELGPGRGTLADDMLRVFSQFPDIKDKLSLHLVEVSPTLSNMQATKLSGKEIGQENNTSIKASGDTLSETAETLNSKPFKQCTSKYGPEVFWYSDLADVPKGLSCFIAHEFLDALPVHKFHKTDKGWREVLVDQDPSADSLRFVIAPGHTPASVAYLKDIPKDDKVNLEVCPTAGLVVQEICSRITDFGGFSLLADYGHCGEKGGTFRAFKDHKLHDPLDNPGSADLTADVDFSYLKKFLSSDVRAFGPITQERFLNNMGIGYRLQALLERANQEQWTNLLSGYKMLTSPEQMGERFKFLSIMAKTADDYVPAGFADLTLDPD